MSARLYCIMGLLDFHRTYKKLFAAYLKHSSFWAPADVKPVSIGLHQPLDGVTNLEYKLLHLIQLTKFFCKEEKALAFNRDRCCHLALCFFCLSGFQAEVRN